MVNLDKIKLIHKEISQTHQDLIKVLDSAELEILKVMLTKDRATKVAIDISLLEEITNLASRLYDKDTQISSILKQIKSSKTVKNEIKDIKRNLIYMKRMFLESSRNIQKDMKKVSLILTEYRERCRIGFVEFLKTLELDLRKTLKPLVPSEVLQEQISFRPIATDPDLLSSLNSVNNDPGPVLSENTVDKLNNHIQLLVNTLEEVAKSLICITQNTYRSYYELVDPNLLYSEPPSPLAAPLPEYFSYDIGNISEENRKKGGHIVLSTKTKERLIEKFMAIHKANGIKSQQTSRKVQEKLEVILTKDIKQADLLQFFKEEGIPVSEREKLVYEVIHSERDGGRDVCLEEVIGLNDRKIADFKAKMEKVQKENREHLRTSIDSSDELEEQTLETFVDEGEKLHRQQSKPNFIEKMNKESYENAKSENRRIASERIGANAFGKPRASTPGKVKKEKRYAKRNKTPIFQKKQKMHK